VLGHGDGDDQDRHIIKVRGEFATQLARRGVGADSRHGVIGTGFIITKLARRQQIAQRHIVPGHMHPPLREAAVCGGDCPAGPVEEHEGLPGPRERIAQRPLQAQCGLIDHARFASIQSAIRAEPSTPENRRSSCRPVGEVTLISVR